jgi:hypothetical protein
VRFTVTGGAILALDNANLRVHDSLPSDRREAFNGRGLAILRPGRAGPMRLTAQADGLPAVSLTVQIREGHRPPAVRTP